MARPVEKKAKNLGYASITIRIDPQTLNKLNEHCRSKGIIRSEFIRNAIIKALQS